MFRQDVAKTLAKHTTLSEKDILSSLEIPPDSTLGDYAFPCFSLAKELKKAPPQIATDLAKQIPQTGVIAKVVATGPYVNVFITPREWVTAFIKQATTLFAPSGNKKKILIEYPSPNTNKPLHLGHVRNMVLGTSVAHILSQNGEKVIQTNLNNDRGIHICKSMLAYHKWGDGKKPSRKPDHFVGEFYVRFEQESKKDESLLEEAQEMLQKWEADNKDVRALWKKMNTWAHEGFEETYKRYGVSFDKEYYESDIYQEGKKIVVENSALFEIEDGATIANLEKFKLPNKVLLRSDGTSIYMTQDLALTRQKMKDFSPDKQLWVVANEQDLHFKQLFAILELLGTPRDSFHHLSYGMVTLPDGKMKSREGCVVDADDLLEDMEVMAAQQIAERHADWPEKRVAEVAQWLAMGAIRFFILKYDATKNFVFNPKSSLSFEGDTGPYVQYTHARVSSIIRKAGGVPKGDVSLLTGEETESCKMLFALRDTFQGAAEQYRPHLIAQQLLTAARAVNSYYHAHPVLQADDAIRDARLVFLDAVRRVLAEGLALLGIHAPEEM